MLRTSVLPIVLVLAACGGPDTPSSSGTSHADCSADCAALPDVTAEEIGTTGVRLWQEFADVAAANASDCDALQQAIETWILEDECVEVKRFACYGAARYDDLVNGGGEGYYEERDEFFRRPELQGVFDTMAPAIENCGNDILLPITWWAPGD